MSEHTEDCSNEGLNEDCPACAEDQVALKPETEAALAQRAGRTAELAPSATGTYVNFPIGTRVKYGPGFLTAVGDEASGMAAGMLALMRGTVKGLVQTADHEPHASVDWDGDDGCKSVICTSWLEVADD